MIESGYVLPLTSEPALFHGRNHAGISLESAEFVSECIAELVSDGCVRELEMAPVIVPSQLLRMVWVKRYWLSISGT